MLVKTEDTPFTILAKVLVVVERLLLLIEVVVETLPFTVLVNTLAEEDILLIVEEATKLVKSVVVETPFTFELKLVPEVESVLLVITLDVATTPLTQSTLLLQVMY